MLVIPSVHLTWAMPCYTNSSGVLQIPLVIERGAQKHNLRYTSGVYAYAQYTSIEQFPLKTLVTSIKLF